MLPNTLNTNEIKNAAGTEVEFQHLDQIGRKRIFGLITEAPASPYRLTISHQESGSGTKKRRRSMVRFDKAGFGAYDPVSINTAAYTVLDIPVGNVADSQFGKDVLANLMSFTATTGAATTVLFDCTGNGAAVLLSGGL